MALGGCDTRAVAAAETAAEATSAVTERAMRDLVSGRQLAASALDETSAALVSGIKDNVEMLDMVAHRAVDLVVATSKGDTSGAAVDGSVEWVSAHSKVRLVSLSLSNPFSLAESPSTPLFLFACYIPAAVDGAGG